MNDPIAIFTHAQKLVIESETHNEVDKLDASLLPVFGSRVLDSQVVIDHIAYRRRLDVLRKRPWTVRDRRTMRVLSTHTTFHGARLSALKITNGWLPTS